MKLLIVNGPNINMLGIREKHIYGDRDYDALCRYIRDEAAKLGAEAEIFQSNHEGAIVDRIQQAYFDGTEGIVINPAGYTHTSVAMGANTEPMKYRNSSKFPTGANIARRHPTTAAAMPHARASSFP